MSNNIRTLTLSLLFLILLPAASHAQSALEKITQSIEDNPGCETSIYREKRDPETRKVISSELVVSFADEKIARRIIEAFKKERHNAVTYSVDNSGRIHDNRFYQIEFENKKGAWSSYSLIFYSRSGKWTFSVKTSIYGNPDNKTRTRGKARSRKTRTLSKELTPDYIYSNGDGSYTKIYLPYDDDARDNKADDKNPLNTHWMLVSAD